MIIVDGRQSELNIGSFANLEEILVNLMGEDSMACRVVTDVLVNEESFSEIYPHQAEDIDSSYIRSLEVRSVPASEMGQDIAGEMIKVSKIMSGGSRQIARLFRQADDAEALDMFQDLLDVTRDFMAMIATLRNTFRLDGDPESFMAKAEVFSNLLSELTEVLENEDWILMADLLEYEFAPACESWVSVIENLRSEISVVCRLN